MGENIGIIVENKQCTRNKIKSVVITVNHGFPVFNVCCGPRSVLMLTSDLRPQQTLSTSNL